MAVKLFRKVNILGLNVFVMLIYTWEISKGVPIPKSLKSSCL
jgi:hypothetical protein